MAMLNLKTKTLIHQTYRNHQRNSRKGTQKLFAPTACESLVQESNFRLYKDDSPLKMGSANEKVFRKNLNGFFERCNVHVRVGAGREFGLVCSQKDEFLAVSPDW